MFALQSRVEVEAPAIVPRRSPWVRSPGWDGFWMLSALWLAPAVWSPPRVLYILGVAIMVALALRSRSPFLFLVIWTSQHWVLATGLASRTPCAEPVPLRGALRRVLHAVNVRPWALVLLLGLSSTMLLSLFEIEANRQEGTYYADRLFGAFAIALRSA
jgi:hypothetical protein